jgi:hypothetical protein
MNIPLESLRQQETARSGKRADLSLRVSAKKAKWSPVVYIRNDNPKTVIA